METTVLIRHSRPVRDAKGQPLKHQARVTVLGALVKADPNSTVTDLVIGVARSSKKDQFSKKSGVSLAMQRANTAPFVNITLSSDTDVRRIFHWIAAGIMNDVTNHPTLVSNNTAE